MKRINPKVYLWASPLFCIDPERSHYHYQFIKNDNKRNYIFSAFKFFLRSSLSGLKKIFNKKIDGTRFIDKEDSNFVIYSPKVFLDLINNKCSYFPNAPKNISYFIVDEKVCIKKNTFRIFFKLFMQISPFFWDFIRDENVSKKITLTFIYLSYFFSLEVISHYYLAINISKICILKNKLKHICLHEMHPYSRIVYGVTEAYKVKSLTLQHAYIHKTRLLLNLREKTVQKFLPSIFYVWGKESKNHLLHFGWPKDKIKLCASERFFYSSYKKNYSNEEKTNKNLNLKDNKIFSILFVPSLLNLDYQLAIQSSSLIRKLYPNIDIYIKLHPSHKINIFGQILICIFSFKSIKISKNISYDLKNKPLIFSYSSTAAYEAPFNDCQSFFIPVMQTETYESINKNEIISIVKKFVNGELVSEYSNPLYISLKRSINFFGKKNESFFKLIN